MPKSGSTRLIKSKARRGTPATASYAAEPVYLPDDLGVGVSLAPLLDALETPAYRYGTDANLLEVEDRRAWSPGAAAPPLDYPQARLITGSPARLAAARARPGRHGRVETFSPVVRFRSPGAVNICVRRQRRKQVLFAKGFYGRAKLRRPTRNAFSSISCRR